MIVKLARYVIVFFLVFVGVAVPLGIYAINDFWGSMFGTELAAVMFVSNMGLGFWSLLAACVLALLGASGLVLRRNWGRVVAIFALGLFAVLQSTMILFSPDQVQKWFSFYEPRGTAGIETLICCASATWLCLPAAKKELYTKRKLA